MREWARTWTGAPIPLSDFSVVVWFDPDRELRPLRAAAFFDRDRAVKAAAGAG